MHVLHLLFKPGKIPGQGAEAAPGIPRVSNIDSMFCFVAHPAASWQSAGIAPLTLFYVLLRSSSLNVVIVDGDCTYLVLCSASQLIPQPVLAGAGGGGHSTMFCFVASPATAPDLSMFQTLMLYSASSLLRRLLYQIPFFIHLLVLLQIFLLFWQSGAQWFSGVKYGMAFF